MTTSYYTPPDHIRGNRLVLPEEEARHAVKVLRTRPGDEIVAVDGEGGWYRVRVDQAGPRGVSGTVTEVRQDVGEPGYELTVALAVLKNPSRYETFLEKATELGVRRIVPLITERTEKERIKASRAQHILIAAMKQSGRSRLVRLDEPVSLAALLHAQAPDLALVCHETADTGQAIAKTLAAHPSAVRITILVGPEGGFAEAEVQAAEEAGYVPVSLGVRRLRAETAALTAAAAVMLLRP